MMKVIHSVGVKSTHPATQVHLIEEEYARYGIRFKAMSDFSFHRIAADLAQADHIIVASTFVYQSMVENGIDEKRLTLVPFGVDTKLFSPKEDRKDRFRALFVGQVCLRKGVQYLLQAWEELGLRDAELAVVGPIAADARQHIEQFTWERFEDGVVRAYERIASASD